MAPGDIRQGRYGDVVVTQTEDGWVWSIVGFPFGSLCRTGDELLEELLDISPVVPKGSKMLLEPGSQMPKEVMEYLRNRAEVNRVNTGEY